MHHRTENRLLYDEVFSFQAEHARNPQILQHAQKLNEGAADMGDWQIRGKGFVEHSQRGAYPYIPTDRPADSFPWNGRPAINYFYYRSWRLSLLGVD